MAEERVLIRVFLVDEHVLIRMGVRQVIQEHSDPTLLLEVVGEASNGREALEGVQRLQPDIVILDVDLADMEGIEAIRVLRVQHPNTQIVVLSTHEEEAQLQAILQAGALGYVLKSAIETEIVQELQAVAQGETFVCAAIFSKIFKAYVAQARFDEEDILLSRREREVLCALAWGHTNKEIAAALFLSPKTVESHRAKGMVKLDLTTRAEIMRYAHTQGWL